MNLMIGVALLMQLKLEKPLFCSFISRSIILSDRDVQSLCVTAMGDRSSCYKVIILLQQ